MQKLSARIEQPQLSRIVLIAEWPGEALPTHLQIRRFHEVNPWLTPVGWKPAAEILPIHAVRNGSELTVGLGKWLARFIDPFEHITFVFPETGRAGEVIWPDLIIPASSASEGAFVAETLPSAPLQIPVKKDEPEQRPAQKMASPSQGQQGGEVGLNRMPPGAERREAQGNTEIKRAEEGPRYPWSIPRKEPSRWPGWTPFGVYVALILVAVAGLTWPYSSNNVSPIEKPAPAPATPQLRPILISEDDLNFAGNKGGPFTPSNQSVTISSRFDGASWRITGVPAWLKFSSTEAAIPRSREETRISATVSATAKDLSLGTHEAWITFHDGDSVTYTRTARLFVGSKDLFETKCDEASFRFDADRIDGRAIFDITALSNSDLDTRISMCSVAYAGNPQRRFLVQQGRLTAEKALRRAKVIDVAGANLAMGNAVELFERAASAGSAYAMNMLGEYYNGAYNGGGFIFADPNQAKALGYWERGRQGGNLVAIHNYAIQQMHGFGTAVNIREAIGGLKRAAAGGHTLSTALLGLAYYDGYPSWFPKYPAEGLYLLKSVYCVEPLAKGKVDKIIERRSDRPTC